MKYVHIILNKRKKMSKKNQSNLNNLLITKVDVENKYITCIAHICSNSGNISSEVLTVKIFQLLNCFFNTHTFHYFLKSKMCIIFISILLLIYIKT